ncbi:hypothetical protein ELBR111191_15875 [Elizabethkingia bruuniana]|nr:MULTISPECIES: hypothetical protein [Elizabethkingia]UTF99468.1 hypothetical protein J2O04_14540 [Elizabethkingia anophelis]
MFNWLLSFGWLILILLPYAGYAVYFLLFEWNWLPDSDNLNMKSFENDR